MLRPFCFIVFGGRQCDSVGMRGLFLLLPLVVIVSPCPASGCAIVLDHRPTWSENLAEAHRIIAGAAAIIDGEVIRPFGGPDAPAIVRVHRILKGPQQAEFEVGAAGGCSVALTDLGERSRMILTGGPAVYDISVWQGDPRLIDALLRSDRRRDWPDVRGVETRP